MRFASKLAIVAAGALLTQPATAALIADFELNGSLANSAGGPAVLTNNGGAVTASGITFGLNQGPSITGLGALAAYTIDIGFMIDALNGPRGNGYVKLIDFSTLTSDSGYYSYNGLLNAYPLSNSAAQVFSAGTPVRLTLSRDATGLITSYINNNQIYSQPDPANASATAIDGLNPLSFFIDDFVTGQGEASTGFVDYIRVLDTAVAPGDIVPPVAPAVPEPATWVMMMLGFGAIGYAMRRRFKARPRVRVA